MKRFAVLLMFAVLALGGCGNFDDANDNSSDYGYNYDWGYKSNYRGNAAQANPPGPNILKEIAVPLVAAVNFGNDIYFNAFNIMIPDLFDNVTREKTDNGTCLYPGTRKYRTVARKLGSAESAVRFDLYCVENQLAPFNNETIIKDNASLKATKSDNSTHHYSEYKMTSDNLSVSVMRYPSDLSDNYTLRGLFEKRRTVRIIDNSTSDNITIGLDMPYDSHIYRFDLYTVTSPQFKKYMNFYHYRYGYVTVDLTFLTNEKLSPWNELTMTYKNGGACVFKPEEIGTAAFNCKAK